MEQTTLTQQIASYAVNNQPLDQDELLPYFKISLYDWLATTVSGRDADCVARIIALTEQSGDAADCLCLPTGRNLPAVAAVRVNTASGHAHDYDDVHETDGLHLNSPVISAAYAVAEGQGALFSDLFRAVVYGMDVENAIYKLLTRSHVHQGWHATATMGGFGAAAAVGNLLGLATVQMNQALGIAASGSSGLLASLGTMTKSLQVANAAQRGLEAALLAQVGFTGGGDILDGEYPSMVSWGTDAADCLSLLQNGPHSITKLAYKRFPCGIPTHANIMNMLKIRDMDGFEPGKIQTIEIEISQFTMDSGCGRLMRKMNLDYGLEGKFSIPFVSAVAALYGKVDCQVFHDETVALPQIVDLMRKTNISVAPDLESTDARMTVLLADGHALKSATTNVRKGLGRADKYQIAQTKFQNEAGAFYGEQKMKQVQELIETLDVNLPVKALSQLLCQY